MKISELFQSQSRESERLVKELAEHESRWPEVERQYQEIDAACIVLAGKLAAARLAGSPTAFEIETDLKAARLGRDRLKHDFERERTRIHTALENLTLGEIRAFEDACLAALKSLPALSHVETLSSDGLSGRHRVTHNAARLEELKESILEAKRDVRTLVHSSLPKIRERIAEWRSKWESIDTRELVEAELTDVQVGILRPPREKETDPARGIVTADGNVFVHGEPASARLDRRLEKLAKGI